MPSTSFAIKMPLGRGVLGTAAAVLVGLAGLASPAAADELNSEGWTVLRPAPDTRFVFVSSSEGDDRNSGRSPAQAVRSLERAYALMRDNSADWMLLRKGDEWHGSFGTWKKSGRSEDERVVIASYGDSDERPRLVCTTQHGIIAPYGQDTSHVAIVGLHFEADRQAGSTDIRGIKWQSVGDDLLIEDCKLEGFATNISIEGVGDGFDNAKIRRSVVVDAWSTTGHSQGIYSGETTGLTIEECLIDRNGWNPDIVGANPTTFNQNAYLQKGVTGVVFKGNISARAAAAGVQMRSGGTAEDNLFYANPMSMRFGYRTIEWPGEAATGAIRNNVVVGGTLSHDVTEVFGFWVERAMDVEVTGNVVTKAVDGDAPIAYFMGGNARNIMMHDNTSYQWMTNGKGQALKSTADTEGEAPGTVTVRHNRWIAHDGDDNKVVNIRALGMMAFWSNDFDGFQMGDEAFRIDGRNATMTDWLDTPNVSQDSIRTIQFVDQERDLKAYARSLGFTDEAAFLEAARSMKRSNWRPELTGAAASAWIRAGFEPAGN